MVDVFVGAERKKYHLHRDLLCERSKFFKASFIGSFKDAEAEEMALPEDNVVSFELLVGWLYGGSLISIPSEYELPAYVDLISLAQKLCLEQLQNETMDHILIFYRTSSQKVAAHTIRSIYENTSAGDRLRILTIRCASWTAVYNETFFFAPDDKDLIKGGGEIAIDFTSMLARYYIHTKGIHERIKEVDPRRKPNCFYHKHNSTPVCGDPSDRRELSRLDSTANGLQKAS